MNTTFRKAAFLFLAFSLLALFTVFGTARGFGSDVGHLGAELERAAR